MQLAATGNGPRVRGFGVLDSERDVPLQLLVKAFPDLPRRDEFSVPPGQGRVINEEIHGDGRLLDGDSGETLRIFEIRDGESDLDALETGEGDDLAGRRRLDLDAVQPFVREELRDFRLLHFLLDVERQERDVVAIVNGATLDAPDTESSEIG